MKIDWVRIKDFRSISDTDKLYIDPMLTVLAGKNESGKSNILRALEVFSTGDFSVEDYPEGKTREESAPEVEVSFKLDYEDMKNFVYKDYVYTAFEGGYNFTIRKRLDYNQDFTYGSIQRYFISKGFLNLMEAFNNSLIDILQGRDVPQIIRDQAEELYREGHRFLESFIKQEQPIYWLMDYHSQARSLIGYFNRQWDNPKGEENTEIAGLATSSEVTKQFINLGEDIFMQYRDFEKKIVIPNFILLESFEKTLPDSVKIFDESEGVWTKYIQKALGVNEGRNVFEMPNRVIKRELERTSKEISSLFQDVYSQNRIRLEFDLGVNNTLDIYVYDDTNYIDFMPSQRSKGFQWFLSFFFAINAVQRNEDIILIDEPGPYLHPSAQNDILKALEILAESDQIIFTTHSPYLINPDTLERVRLVTRDNKNCTIIENQIHAASFADQEVYTPIMTAIGLDLSKSFGTFGDHNVIVEGISDYYYLEIMKKYINYDEAFGVMRFIPSIGASQIDKLASLLIGWGVKFKVLLDNDNAGKKEKKELEQKLLLTQEQLIFVSDNPQFAIEDLFSREDFLNYIMPDLELSEKEDGLENSRLLNKKKKSKALIAKAFKEKLQKEPDIKLTSQTIDNFTVLFQKLYGVHKVTAEEMQRV
ncbi:AAA family ATPase [Bacillus mycoides]|uniref:AAA family ATPase n=1 Tax=Bacillus mycoides TaxID=1405 RepID=UPI00187915A7|nr:AAA family ATPase [Bacillus mycoides]MBE7150020.1 AAA family ATPase [Bacillus mycoides]